MKIGIVLTLFLSLALVSQHTPPKLAIVDLATASLEKTEKEELLSELRKNFQWQAAFEVLRGEEISKLTRQIDPLRAAEEQDVSEHKSRFVSLEGQIRQASQFYAESRFEEALGLLNSAWFLAESTYLALSRDRILELLTYRAACQFFMNNMEEARESFELIRFLSPSRVVDSSRFPPELLRFENTLRDTPVSLEEFKLSTNETGIELVFLGATLAKASGRSLDFQLPKLEMIQDQKLVFQRTGYAKQAYPVKSVPESVELQAFKEESFDTSELFGVLGALSPSPELLNFLRSREIEVSLLLGVEKDLHSKWLMRGQLFRTKDRARSPVVEAVAPTQAQARELLARRLMVYVSPKGDIIEANKIEFVDRTEPAKPIYKKWWFWTAVGLGATGVGVGSYYLFKPDPELRFEVRPGGG